MLGPIAELREADGGADYAVPLFDTSYNRDLIPGIRAGVYGASFRFGVVRQDFDRNPGKSEHNPDGIPERTIREAKVMEFGPVTFPAYPDATAGLRSITDEVTIGRFLEDPVRLRMILAGAKGRPGVAERADIASISILTQMYELGQWFIATENDDDDQADRDAMGVILGLIGDLVKSEADEPEDDPADRSASAGDDKTAAGEAASTASTAQDAPGTESAASRTLPEPRRKSLAINPTTLHREESPSWIL